MFNLSRNKLIVLLSGAFLLLLEVLYVPKKVFYIVGPGRSLVVKPLVYAWLPSMPANSVIHTGRLTAEIVITVLLIAVAYGIVSLLDLIRRPGVTRKRRQTKAEKRVHVDGIDEIDKQMELEDRYIPNPAIYG